MMKLSIVTVTLNDEDTIEQTIAIVFSEKLKDGRLPISGVYACFR